MKKIFALLLALSLVFAFAACGKDEADAPAVTTNAAAAIDTDDPFAGMEDDLTTAPSDAATDPNAPTTAADPNAPTTAVDPNAPTTAADPNATTVAEKGLTSSDAAAVVAYYNAAVIKTNEEGAPAGQSTMKLGNEGKITGDGAIGAILKVLSPAAEKALAKNSTPTDYIPGKGELQAGDVVKAMAKSEGGVTTIVIQLKEQTDGSDADSKVGPVGRGIGTLGSIDGALKELGAELLSGRDTVKLTYTDSIIKCTIDENTGKITHGTWMYTVNIFVGDAQAKLGIKANLKNLKAVVDYQVAI